MRALSELVRTASRGLRGARAYSSWGNDLLQASGASFAPTRAIIYAPARVAGQHGLAQTVDGGGPAWKVYFPPSKKWSNPLMGWTSSGDALETVGRQIYFSSKEAAIEFAESHKWEYTVEEPNVRRHIRPKRYGGYGDNFSTRRAGVPVGGLRSEAAAAPAAKAPKAPKAPKA